MTLTRLVREVLPFVALAALLTKVTLSSLAPLSNDDTFFHLRFGHEFLSGWKPWDPDHITALDSSDWLPTQWLSQVIMGATEEAFGLAGIAWLSGLLLLAYVGALWHTTRSRSAPLVAALVTCLAFVASAPALSARPQVISYVLVAALTHVWLRTAEDGRIRWWLIPVGWVWAMLHGMWPVGIAISVVAVIGIALDRGDLRWMLRAALVPVGMLVTAALTPVGPRLIEQVLLVTGRGDIFTEWRAPDYTELAPMFLAALFAITILLITRGGSRPWSFTLLLVLAAGWALYSNRTVPVAAAMLAPLGAITLQEVVGPWTAATLRERLGVLAGGIAGLAAIGLVAPGTAQVDRPLPPSATTYLEGLAPGTVVLNEWAWGGRLMWEHPDLTFVLHGYADVFTDEELRRNLDLDGTRPGWRESLVESRAEVAVLDPDGSLAEEIELAAGWLVVFEDDDVVVLEQP